MAIEFNCTGDPLDIEVRDYQIESGNYRVEVGFNNRSGWYVSIYDTDDTPILLGLTLISEPQNITWRYSRVNTGLFTGDMWVFNKTGDYTNTLSKANFGEGKAWGLFYFTAAEMIEYGINKR
jgi:hypothetical protein